MKSYGIPKKIIRVVEALYNNFESAVIDERDKTDWLKIKTGVKQECNISGFLICFKSRKGDDISIGVPEN